MKIMYVIYFVVISHTQTDTNTYIHSDREVGGLGGLGVEEMGAGWVRFFFCYTIQAKCFSIV